MMSVANGMGSGNPISMSGFSEELAGRQAGRQSGYNDAWDEANTRISQNTEAWNGTVMGLAEQVGYWMNLYNIANNRLNTKNKIIAADEGIIRAVKMQLEAAEIQVAARDTAMQELAAYITTLERNCKALAEERDVWRKSSRFLNALAVPMMNALKDAPVETKEAIICAKIRNACLPSFGTDAKGKTVMAKYQGWKTQVETSSRKNPKTADNLQKILDQADL
jgi:hypothetical protein